MNISSVNGFLNKYFSSEDASPDMETSLGLDGDTTLAARMWKKIANGTCSVPEALLFAQVIAQRVVESVIEGDLEGGERSRAALASLGFRGPIDRHREVKQAISVFKDFQIDISNPKLVDYLQDKGFLKGMSRKQALTRVAEWRKGDGTH
jgi:hypothetical protein